jgi:hypothetical protein
VKRAAVLTLAMAAWLACPVAAQQPDRFDHQKHRSLFPTCIGCHPGADQADRPLWPDSTECITCHDGVARRRVTWQYPPPPRTNLSFDHATHRAAVQGRPAAAGTAPPACMDCHAEVGAAWMAVQPPVVSRCFACHGLQTAHFAAPDSACSTCHVPLARAALLTRADVAAFEVPPSHRDSGFARGTGHGRLATRPGGGVAASCATCHAREFCLTCHVDGPEQPVIQALAPDPRSTAITARMAAPASHTQAGFIEGHAREARADLQSCATCHTRESCLTCHVGRTRMVAALYAAGPGRGAGAVITRHPPPSHVAGFAEHHAGEAAARSATCAGCHTRADCLACHRPTAASAPGYHPAGFLARHPVAAYSRETRCSDCHNTGAFCVTCHAQSGLVATGVLGNSGYHDAKRFFDLGHGQAARQDLESCTGCHVERDCLTCHSAVGGRHFDPHGPGFDAERLRRKNPQMCTACHGTNIPQ